jgi:hypothetical protein
MKNYRVSIELMPISYEFEAENEEKAREFAMDCFFDEKIHNIFKNAELQIQLLKTGEYK